MQTTVSGKQHPDIKELTVFETGQVINTRTRKPYAFQKQHGSLYLNIIIDGKPKRLNVALMIYTAFHGPLEPSKRLYFVDNDRNNVREDNLMALTESQFYEYVFQQLLKSFVCARHAVFTHLVAIDDGRVFSLKLNTFIKGYKSDKGYSRLTGIDVHKLVFESFNGLVDSKIYHIDHINNVHDDNRITNLQKLIIAEHNLKTRKDSPQASQKTGQSLSKPLIRTKLDSKGNVIEKMSFKTVHEAIEQTEKQFPAIKCTKNGLIPRVDKKTTYKGFYWTSQPSEDLPGEEWRLILLSGFRNLKASSLGRIEFANGRRTFGTKEGKYKSIGHGGKNYPVHFLVCVAFHLQKHPSSLEDKLISVDHINHKEDDNRAENLRWASKSQQCANKRMSKKIIALTKSTSAIIKEFNTSKETAEHFGVAQDLVRRVLSGKIKNSKYFNDVTFQTVDNTFENSVPDSAPVCEQHNDIIHKNRNQYSGRSINAIQISTGANIGVFQTIEEIASYFDVSYKTTASLVNGTTKTSKTLTDVRFEVMSAIKT